MPNWFSEGFATHFGGDGEWGREWQLYRVALRQRTHTTAELERALEKGGAQKALAGAEATDFFAYLLKGEKTAKFAAAIERLRQGDDAASALGTGYGVDIGVLEREWHRELGRRATVTTIVAAVGVPALALLTYALLRARRRRAALVRVKARKSRNKGGGEPERVHIVLSRRDDRADRIDPSMIASDADVPKVEHEGEWHTLH